MFYADELHNQVSAHKLSITPCRGEYQLLTKKPEPSLSLQDHFRHFPRKVGRAFGHPTVHGNLLVGPTAENLSDKEAVNTTQAGLADVMEKGRLSVPSLPGNLTITSFAGLRASEAGGDFVIGEAEDAPGFFDCAGTDLPVFPPLPQSENMLQSWFPISLGLPARTTLLRPARAFPVSLPLPRRN